MSLNIDQILSLIDLTSLGDDDSDESINELCQKAESRKNVKPASICVYPQFSKTVNKAANIPLAVVAGDFPSGKMPSQQKLDHLASILHSGIAEVDWVINPAHAKNYDKEALSSELNTARTICSDQVLKIIIESGELNAKQVEFATNFVIESGADFVKTSTGKMSTGATEEDVRLICQILNSYYIKTGKRVGIKVSGGVRTSEDAQAYINIVKDELGETWLNKELFRIGASSLWDNLINQLSE